MGASDVESNLLLCLANGGHLAYIETVAENDCLNQYIQEGKLESFYRLGWLQ